MTRFVGKVVAVTGGASGIGAAAVKAFHAEGASVAIFDRDSDGSRRISAALGERVMWKELDVGDAEQAKAGLAEAHQHFGALDVLVNNAGVRDIHTALELPPERWRQVMRVNVDGVFHMAQAFLRLVRAANRPAAIVNVSSTAGLIGIPNRPVYTASKHAVVGLTKELATDFGRLGVRVNCVCPGMVYTPMTASYFADPEDAERLRQSSPLGREGRPEEIAAVILFLASEEASFVNGAIVPVDGGFTAGKGR